MNLASFLLISVLSISMSYRDQWLYSRPAVKTDKIKKKIVLAGGTWNCGFPKSCVYFSSHTDDYIVSATELSDMTEAFTVEAWIKVDTFDANARTIFCRERTAGVLQWKFQIADGYPVLTTRVGGSTTITTGTVRIPIGAWCHVAAVFDNANTDIHFYIDGVLASSHAYSGGALTARVDGQDIIGSDEGGTSLNAWVGYLDELRIWSDIRTTDELFFYRSSPQGASEAGLVGYFRFDEGSGITTENLVDDTLWSFAASGPIWVTDDGYPIKFGGSWVVAQYEIAAGKKSSLRFPVEAPDNVDHALVVRWEDEDGVIQRRYLYTTEGVDFYSDVTQYAGEKLSATYYIEVWNIDGNRSVTLPETTLYSSVTSQPTTGADRTSQALVTAPSADTSLAESFTLSNPPFEFDTAQTF